MIAKLYQLGKTDLSQDNLTLADIVIDMTNSEKLAKQCLFVWLGLKTVVQLPLHISAFHCLRLGQLGDSSFLSRLSICSDCQQGICL